MTSQTRSLIVAYLLLALVAVPNANAQKERARATDDAVRLQRLQTMLTLTANETISAFAAKKLQTNQLAITLVDFRDPLRPIQASYRGDAPVYPASVIKLFYLMAAHRWMED